MIDFLNKPELAPPGIRAFRDHADASISSPIIPLTLSRGLRATRPVMARKVYHHAAVEYDYGVRFEFRQVMWQTPYGDTPQAGPSDKLRGNVFAEERIRDAGRRPGYFRR